MFHILIPQQNKLLFQVESIMLSIISMLSGPNDESPANVEAAVSHFNLLSLISFYAHSLQLRAEHAHGIFVFSLVQKEWREKRDEFKKKVSRCVRKSQEML